MRGSKAAVIARRLLKAVKLDTPARRLRDSLRAHGILKWVPLVPESEFMDSVRHSVEVLEEEGHEMGAYVEFGVSRGTSLACAYKVLRDAGYRDVEFVGFDSFAGLPSYAGGDQGWRPGQYRSTRRATERFLRKAGLDLRDVTLVEGWFDETLDISTLERLGVDKCSLVMVDCDIYSSSKRALEFSAQLIDDRAVIILDDWGWRSEKGEIGQREAFEEFLAAHPFVASPLPAYMPQARIFMVTREG